MVSLFLGNEMRSAVAVKKLPACVKNFFSFFFFEGGFIK